MNTAKIEARREIIAKTYASLMKWAISVEIVPAGTSLEIGDYYNLDQPIFAAISSYGFPAIVAEHKGLTDALNMIES